MPPAFDWNTSLSKKLLWKEVRAERAIFTRTGMWMVLQEPQKEACVPEAFSKYATTHDWVLRWKGSLVVPHSAYVCTFITLRSTLQTYCLPPRLSSCGACGWGSAHVWCSHVWRDALWQAEASLGATCPSLPLPLTPPLSSLPSHDTTAKTIGAPMMPGASLHEGQPLADRRCVTDVAFLLHSWNKAWRLFGCWNGFLYPCFLVVLLWIQANCESKPGETVDGAVASRRVYRQIVRNWRNLEHVWTRCTQPKTSDSHHCF